MTLGVGIVIFGLLALILAGALGGPSSPQNGDLATILLALGACAGLGGFSIIVWGLTAS